MKLIYDILPVNNYQGNGVCDKFDFDFYIEDKSQLKVCFFDENSIKTELINDLDYTINEVGNKNGSYIVFPIETSNYNVLKENQKISLELSLPAQQLTQYNNSSLLNLSALEYSFDYLTRLIQILKRKLELCVKVEEISDNTPQELMDNLSNQANIAQQKAQEASGYAQIVSDIKNEMDGKIFQFNNDIENINQSINSKANLALDNLSSAGKSLASCYAMPSTNSTKLTIGASGSTYTMPANGYLVAFAKSTGSTGTAFVWLGWGKMFTKCTQYYDASNKEATLACYIPVKKGAVVTYNYTLMSTVDEHRLEFVYAQGEI